MSLTKLAAYAIHHDVPLHLGKNEDGQLMLSVEGLGKTWIHPSELASNPSHERLLDAKASWLLTRAGPK